MIEIPNLNYVHTLKMPEMIFYLVRQGFLVLLLVLAVLGSNLTLFYKSIITT
jgi:hypothetical protein